MHPLPKAILFSLAAGAAAAGYKNIDESVRAGVQEHYMADAFTQCMKGPENTPPTAFSKDVCSCKAYYQVVMTIPGEWVGLLGRYGKNDFVEALNMSKPLFDGYEKKMRSCVTIYGIK